MFRKLVKTREIGDRRTQLCGALFRAADRARQRGATAARSLLEAADRIIVDDDSMTSLESKVDAAGAGDDLQPAAGGAAGSRVTPPDMSRRWRREAPRQNKSALWRAARAGAQGPTVDTAAYLRGRTASFSCLAIRALTTVLAGILIASPVAGLRPIRAFRFCTTSFTIPGQHELAGALQLLLRKRGQLVEELPRLRPLHFEAIREVREEFGFAHPAGLCHRLFPLLGRAVMLPARSAARACGGSGEIAVKSARYPSARRFAVSIDGSRAKPANFRPECYNFSHVKLDARDVPQPAARSATTRSRSTAPSSPRSVRRPACPTSARSASPTCPTSAASS